MCAEPLGPGATFGWKSSSTHWNDYAVGSTIGASTWTRINRSGNMYDMAFVLTVPEPAALGLVFLGGLLCAGGRRKSRLVVEAVHSN